MRGVDGLNSEKNLHAGRFKIILIRHIALVRLLYLVPALTRYCVLVSAATANTRECLHDAFLLCHTTARVNRHRRQATNTQS